LAADLAADSDAAVDAFFTAALPADLGAVFSATESSCFAMRLFGADGSDPWGLSQTLVRTTRRTNLEIVRAPW
jgi:hypothetical protein